MNSLASAVDLIYLGHGIIVEFDFLGGRLLRLRSDARHDNLIAAPEISKNIGISYNIY